jgi:hypothetical protein
MFLPIHSGGSLQLQRRVVSRENRENLLPVVFQAPRRFSFGHFHPFESAAARGI